MRYKIKKFQPIIVIILGLILKPCLTMADSNPFEALEDKIYGAEGFRFAFD